MGPRRNGASPLSDRRRPRLPAAAGCRRSRTRSVPRPARRLRAASGGKRRGADAGERSREPSRLLARRKGADGRPFLDPAQIEAGERFRRDIEQAQILQRVTANWESSGAGARRGADAGVVVTEIALDARKRLARAYDAVGPDLAGLLTDMCGYLKGLETVESERGWPARSGKVVLKIALARLARHYGIGAAATGPARAKSLVHWGAEDYRPSL
ncbi:DUF6456 domain-containing protein [Methylocystis echinoides]|uniref:DUF6456 domain-containing protein n=1 Tax=Methylocystis echinoides TaxID=29468 RepID=UPI00344A72E9